MQGYSCEYTDHFRVKNISTGLFMAISKDNSNQLVLERNGNLPQCAFKLIPRKNVFQTGRIEYTNLLKLQTVDRNYIKIDKEVDENILYSIQAE